LLNTTIHILDVIKTSSKVKMQLLIYSLKLILRRDRRTLSKQFHVPLRALTIQQQQRPSALPISKALYFLLAVARATCPTYFLPIKKNNPAIKNSK